MIWRCKDCKAPFSTYEAAAEHIRKVHQRPPRSKNLAEAMKMLDDMEALIKTAGKK